MLEVWGSLSTRRSRGGGDGVDGGGGGGTESIMEEAPMILGVLVRIWTPFLAWPLLVPCRIPRVTVVLHSLTLQIG